MPNTPPLAPSLSPRLVVAPVGLQSIAVLAPLLGLQPPLGPHDLVVLIPTAQSRDGAARVASLIHRTRGAPVEIALWPDAADGQRALLDGLRARLGERVPWVVCNGGEWRTLVPCLDALDGPSLRALVSRDVTLWSFDRTGALVSEVSLDDLPRPLVLDVQGLTYEGRTLRHVPSAECLEGVVDLFTHRGLLHAVIDATDWEPDTYRDRSLRAERLQRFGLVDRRIMLMNASKKLADRAGGDRIVCATPSFGPEAWKRGVVEDAILSGSPADRSAPSFRSPAPTAAGDGSWSGPTLLVGVGPNAATTLLALWAHQPARAIVVYDPASPWSVENAARLMELPCGAAALTATPLDRLGDLATETGDAAVEANLTPGDKRMSLALYFAARPAGTCWSLSPRDRATTRLPDGASRTGEPVPVEVMTRMNGQGPVTFTARVVDLRAAPLPALARAYFTWEARREKDEPGLALGAWGRLDRSLLRDGSLHWPDHAPVLLDSLPAGFLLSVSDGKWFEWMVAAAVADARVEEVFLGLSARWGGHLTHLANSPRDELDVVSRHYRSYAYWSCKLGTKFSTLVEHLGAARAQSDKLLGARGTAIVVVPRLRPTEDRALRARGIEVRGPGHWIRRGTNHIDHVIDARVLADRAAVLRLARGELDRA